MASFGWPGHFANIFAWEGGEVNPGHDIVIPLSCPPDLLLANPQYLRPVRPALPARMRSLGARVPDLLKYLAAQDPLDSLPLRLG